MSLTKFEQSVLTLVSQIPAGRVSTYAALARKLGRPRAVRAVGNALHKNPLIGQVPCHRIIRSDGQVGGYRLGAAKKAALLKTEGATVNQYQTVVDFERLLYQF